MKPILNLEKVTKHYSGVVALDKVDLQIYKGKVHSIVGENGAGKSTLIKIITGAVKPSKGRMLFNDKLVEENSPRKSLEMGISAVYQELNLIPELKVYENIFFGRELKNGVRLDRKKMRKIAIEVLESIGIKMDVDRKIKDLGVGSRQTVEIAKCLVQNAEVVLFDEPTASLTEEEANRLHKIIYNLKENGIAIIYVSHKLDEVFKISDTITVIRDGKHIKTTHIKTEPYSQEEVVEHMVGREVVKSNQESTHNIDNKEIVLELKNVLTNQVKDISFKLHKGEILSISGLLGSKRTEVLNAIFGVDKLKGGEIFVNNKKVSIKSPLDAIKLKIGYVTEDRKDTGLFMGLPIRENTSVVFLKKYIKGIILDKKLEKTEVEENLSDLQVKYSNINQKSKELSGGNQQKIAIGKWLLEDLDIIMLDEPTRGVDVGAKEEIYRIMFQLVRDGKSLLIVSSEADEIINLSDRTIVMSEGEMVSEYYKGEITSEKILKDSAGINAKGDY